MDDASLLFRRCILLSYKALGLVELALSAGCCRITNAFTSTLFCVEGWKKNYFQRIL